MGGSASTPCPPTTPEPYPSHREGPPADIYARTGYDPRSRWRTYANLFRDRVTPHGKYLFAEDLFHKREAADCQRCDADLRYLLAYSPIVRFLSEKISDLGGAALVGDAAAAAAAAEGGGDGADAAARKANANVGKIKCERCITRVVPRRDAQGRVVVGADGEVEREYVRKSGGFQPDVGITLCANETRTRDDMQDVLAHEMVHAWDHLRWKVDWLDLRHAACSEIRASTLSGECRWAQEFFARSHFAVSQQFQACVRARAAESLLARPNCRDAAMAARAVNEVFESCFNDTRPFDEVYR